MPDIEVTRDCLPGRVADRKLRNLDQPRLDGINQAEVAHDPRERPIGLLPDFAKEIRRRRKIDADIDAAELVDAVEPIHPDGGLLLEGLGVFLVFELLLEQFSLLCVCSLMLDPVGVMGLVVHHEDVLLAAYLAANDPVDERGIALDALLRLHEHFLKIPCAVPVLLDNDDLGKVTPQELMVLSDESLRIMLVAIDRHVSTGKSEMRFTDAL